MATVALQGNGRGSRLCRERDVRAADRHEVDARDLGGRELERAWDPFDRKLKHAADLARILMGPA